MKKVIVLFSILFLASCSGTGKKYSVLYQEIKTNQTQIFVKRQTGYHGLAALIKVTLDGKKIGALGNSERLSATTNVESGVLSAGFTGLASIASSSASRQFRIKKGEKLFFVIKQDIGFASSTLRIYGTDQNDFFSN
jgi:hypothetical protein